MYSLEFFSSIVTDNIYVLPDTVKSSLSKLHTALGVDRTKVATYTQSYSHSPRKSRNDNGDQWKKKEQFKTTVIVKAEGTTKLLSDIKNGLNKLSETKYDIHANVIFNIIDELLLPENNPDGTMEQTIFNLIESTACMNHYWSALYAKICKTILDKHPNFVEIKNNWCTGFNENEFRIDTVDPSEDYNKFCEINKENDKRRYRLLFIINLYNEKYITQEELLNIILVIENRLQLNLKNKEYAAVNEELTELMYMFISNMVNDIKSNSIFSNIRDWINVYSTSKPKDNPGFTNRSMFKFMDMRDLFK
jgi:hypothetical protein